MATAFLALASDPLVHMLFEGGETEASVGGIGEPPRFEGPIRWREDEGPGLSMIHVVVSGAEGEE